MTADKPPQLELPIRRMLELERAEKIVTALARGELPALTDAELEQIIAIAGEDAPLFDPDTLELDGWRRDHSRSWVPPDIHAIDAIPDRGQGEQLPQPAPGSASGTPGSSTAAQKTAAQKTAAQKTAAQKTAAQKTAAQKTAAQKTAAQKTAAQKTAAQKTAAQKLTELTPAQFLAECEAIRNDKLRERWAKDPENWIHRWDRRADWIERWGGRQLP